VLKRYENKPGTIICNLLSDCGSIRADVRGTAAGCGGPGRPRQAALGCHRLIQRSRQCTGGRSDVADRRRTRLEGEVRRIVGARHARPGPRSVSDARNSSYPWSHAPSGSRRRSATDRHRRRLHRRDHGSARHRPHGAGQGGLSKEPMWEDRLTEIRALRPRLIRLFIQEYFDLLPARGNTISRRSIALWI